MARKRVTWSVRARRELGDTLRFYRKRNGNDAYSRKLRSEFRKASERIGENDEIGESLEGSNDRFVVVENYQLFYRENENEIIVIAVWDGRRDPETLDLNG